MLIQRREGVLRLIRQHDHALLAGALAFQWRTPDGTPLAWTTALATALHDVVWLDEDRTPRLDPTTGAPYDFVTIPPPLKRTFVERGVARLTAVDSEVADLVEAHHRALAEGASVEGNPPLAWIRFFDALSLLLCLTPPGATSRPRWLHATLRPPDGPELAVLWEGEGTVTLAPYPLGGAVAAPIPYRDLPARRFDSQEDLAGAWSSAAEERWVLRLEAPGAAGS